MNSQISLIQQVDALLPQTQCGLCGHRDGCLPYAQSIILGEDANKCVPGGQPVADALAELLNRTKLTAEESVWPIQIDGRPQRMKAVIREDECIGCTKCISACPVDAIIGSGKLKVWKDTREPGRIILKNEFDRNFGLLMEALEKIAKQNAFDFLINLNLCEIRCSDNYQIEAGESTHQAIYNCLIKYLKECQ